ncbi:zinc-binding dehydrogenase domain-containing protein [Ditylenchus destructor]|nr:zinc-binding dehydrogenase domain-containing protein [Ditylenchus destructor]
MPSQLSLPICYKINGFAHSPTTSPPEAPTMSKPIPKKGAAEEVPNMQRFYRISPTKLERDGFKYRRASAGSTKKTKERWYCVNRCKGSVYTTGTCNNYGWLTDDTGRKYKNGVLKTEHTCEAQRGDGVTDAELDDSENEDLRENMQRFYRISKTKLERDGFEYGRNGSSKTTKEYWYCEKRSDRKPCKGSVHTYSTCNNWLTDDTGRKYKNGVLKIEHTCEAQRGDGVTDAELDDSENEDLREGEETGPAEAEQFQPEAAIRVEGEVARAQRAAGEMGQLDMEFAANVTLRDANEDEALDALNDGPDMIEGAEVNVTRASEVSLSSHTTEEADSTFFSVVSRKNDSPEKRYQRAAVVRKFGAAENILVESGIPIPTVGDKQILVQVHSADVNPVDTYIRSGSYAALPSLPYTPGRGGAGIISKIGTNVEKLKVGDRVWFNQAITGSAAQFALTLTELTFPLSKELSFSQGATLGISYMTAYKALFDEARAKAGESVLIHGLSDGVGLAAAQLALAHGLRVAGTLSTQQQSYIEWAKKKKVTLFNEEESNDFIKKHFKDGFKIILQVLPNVNLGKDIDLLANNGRIIAIGNRGSIKINKGVMDVKQQMRKWASVISVVIGLSTIEEKQRMGERINALIEAGHVSPYVGQHFPLDRIAEAHNAVVAQSNGELGKIVIDIEHGRE